MDELAIQQISHRCQADVRMRQDINTFAGREFDWPHVVEKNEWAYKPE